MLLVLMQKQGVGVVHNGMFNGAIVALKTGVSCCCCFLCCAVIEISTSNNKTEKLKIWLRTTVQPTLYLYLISRKKNQVKNQNVVCWDGNAEPRGRGRRIFPMGWYFVPKSGQGQQWFHESWIVGWK
jgi:hypothetical protein